MSRPVRIPADVDREDRVLANLTARQLLILTGAGVVLYGLWSATRTLVPLGVFLIVAVPIGVVAAVLALGRRDGIMVDRLVLAAIRQRLRPRCQVAAPEGVPPVPWWLSGRVFEANIYFPAAHTLAYSDHLLLQAFVLWPLYAATGDLVLCYNVLLLASLVSAPLPAQENSPVDLTGTWRWIPHEDERDRNPGAYPGDYRGLPLNDAARMRADTYDEEVNSTSSVLGCKAQASARPILDPRRPARRCLPDRVSTVRSRIRPLPARLPPCRRADLPAGRAAFDGLRERPCGRLPPPPQCGQGHARPGDRLEVAYAGGRGSAGDA